MARDFYVVLGSQKKYDDVRVRYPIAAKYHYLNGGGGNWYSKGLQRLRCGDRVFAYVGRKGNAGGYVGMGQVTGEAIFARDATVQGGGLLVCQPDIDADFVDRAWRDDDTTELVVPVEWMKIVPIERAVWETGLFSHQRTVCELKAETPRHRRTVKTVEARFGVSRDTTS